MLLSRPVTVLKCVVRISASQEYSSCRRFGYTRHTKSSISFPTAADIVARAPDKWKPYLQIMRADKPIGTWLLYWPCTWSIALATPAGHLPSLYLLSLFGCGAFLMRGAGCVINDLWDKDFDKKVERTKMRPLACGSLKTREAVTLLGGLLLASSSILFRLNNFSIAVGVSSLLLVVAYPAAKRYTYWPQFVLGATLNWGVLIAWAEMVPADQFFTVLPLYLSTILYTVIYDTIYSHQHLANTIYSDFQLGMVVCMQYTVRGMTFNWGALLGWTAVTGQLSLAPLALYLAALQWTLVYDTIYAHQDKADDIMIGVKSTALRFGDQTKTWLSGFATTTLGGLALAGYLADQTWPYYAALGGAPGPGEAEETNGTDGHLAVFPKFLLVDSGYEMIKDTFRRTSCFASEMLTGVKRKNPPGMNKEKKAVTLFHPTVCDRVAIKVFDKVKELCNQPADIPAGNKTCDKAGTAAHLAWQISTVNIDDGSDCWRKFKSNSWMGVILFSGIVFGNLIKKVEDGAVQDSDIYSDDVASTD